MLLSHQEINAAGNFSSAARLRPFEPELDQHVATAPCGGRID
jgi:hypothetical protein